MLTILLSPCSGFHLEKLPDLELVKKFPAYYGTSEVHSRIYKSPTPFPILSQINPALAPASHFFTLYQISVYPMFYEMFRQMVFMATNCDHLTQRSTWKTTSCRLSSTAYSVYSQLPSTSRGRSSSQNVT